MIDAKSIIGQTSIIRALNFHIQCFERTKVIQPIFIAGENGLGKTSISKAFASNLSNSQGKKRKTILLNGASVKSLGGFVEGFIIPKVIDSELTLILDEFHAMDKRTLDWMLSVLTPKDNVSIVKYGDSDLCFDFRRFSLIAASTNPEKLTKPLLARFRRYDLQPYSINEQISILRQKVKELDERVEFEEKVEELVIKICRSNPRQITQKAKDIVDYCLMTDKFKFGIKQWQELKDVLSIRPLGLNNNEYAELKALAEFGPQTLTTIAAKLGLDSGTVRREVEIFLLKNGLIEIDGKRKLTARGKQVLIENSDF